MKSRENPKDIVRNGYDKVSYAYRAETFDYEHSGYKTFLSWLLPRLGNRASVLDLGCGCGIPVAQVLSQQHQVTGVDISPVQIERARELVPTARFICEDMSGLYFSADSFDAIVAFFSIIHLPIDEQPALFAKLAHWLKPGAYLLASVGHAAWTGTEADWRGVQGATMYWSHHDSEAYRRLLEENDLQVLQEGFLPEGEGGHTIFLSQKLEKTRAPG